MAERYEKVKHFTAITTAILLSTSLLTGCGASTQTTASNSVQVATEQAAEESQELVDPLDWTPLAELDTHAELRSSFEELTNIFTAKDGTKTGILYGECTIKKLYYTEVIDTDGNIKEIKDIDHKERKKTTNYISIDNEEGYSLVGWKTSKSNADFATKSKSENLTRVCQVKCVSFFVLVDKSTWYASEQ